MAYSYADTVASGDETARRLIAVPFPYISRDHVRVFLNEVLVPAANYTWLNGSQIQLAVAPAVGTERRVQRTTPSSSPLVSFGSGVLSSEDLNTANKQTLYLAQETADGVEDTSGLVDSALTYLEDISQEVSEGAAASEAARALAAAAASEATISAAIAASYEGGGYPKASFAKQGAVGGGTVDATAAIVAALTMAHALGVALTGEGQTYGVVGNITLPAGVRIEDVKFRQLAPNSTSRRTLHASDGDNITLIRVVVERNGTGTEGSLNDAAGIWITGGSGHRLVDVEVRGSGMGSGIVLAGASRFTLVNPYVHDILYTVGSNPGDDRVQGIWCSGCSDFSITNPRVEDLGGTIGGGALNRIWSRGIALGLGCNNFVIWGGRVARCDQGLDLTGSGGCWNFRIFGTGMEDCQTWGLKIANYNRFGIVTGATALRCGSAGFVTSGPSGALEGEPSDYPKLVLFVGCIAINSGYQNTGRGTSQPAGFLITPGGLPDFPRGVEYHGCFAIDNQAVPTQYDGFRNEVTFGGLPANKAINCVVLGLNTGAGGLPFRGFPVPASFVGHSSGSALPNAAWTSVAFNAEYMDSMAMHNSASNIDIVTIQEPGIYKIEGQIGFETNATGTRQGRISVNGAAVTTSVMAAAGSGTGPVHVTPTHFSWLPGGTNVVLEAFQNSGGALALRGGETKLLVYKAMPHGTN